MENFGGRVCLADNRSTQGYNYMSNRALMKEEKWLEKVANDNRRLLSREEAKVRKSLERLKQVRYSSPSKEMMHGAVPTPDDLSRRGSSTIKHDEQNHQLGSQLSQYIYQHPHHHQSGQFANHGHQNHQAQIEHGRKEHHSEPIVGRPNKDAQHVVGYQTHQKVQSGHFSDSCAQQHQINDHGRHGASHYDDHTHQRTARHDNGRRNACRDPHYHHRDHHQASDHTSNTHRVVHHNQDHHHEYDPAHQFNPAVAHHQYNDHSRDSLTNIREKRIFYPTINKGSHHQVFHQVKVDDGHKNHAAVKLPNISTKHTSTGQHVPFTKIHAEDDYDVDTDGHAHIGSHSRMAKYHNASSSVKAFYDEAIQKLKSEESSPRYYDQMSIGSLQSDSKRFKAEMERLELDREAFKELEGIIKDAKQHSHKKDGSTGNQSFTHRHQKRRLQHLEQLLEELRPRVKPQVHFDPSSILECRYLRLSKANVESLESMIKESGGDPGIHAHTDVQDYDIWGKD